MKAALLILACICASVVAAAELPPGQQLRAFIDSQAETGSVFAQATLDGVDYRKLLRGAVAKDPVSLTGIFGYTKHGKLMGEGADSNGSILRQLLRLWGDAAYARVLGSEPGKVRAAVISALKEDWPFPGWEAKDFPLTHALGRHDSGSRK